MHTIDKTDRQIIQILTENARTSYQDIAKECGISAAAIHQRVKKLSEAKVILGTRLMIDPKKLSFNTSAYVGIFLEKAQYYKQVLEALKQINEVVEASFTTGNYSLLTKIYARDNVHLMQILSEKIQIIDGIARTETFIVLEQGIERGLTVR